MRVNGMHSRRVDANPYVPGDASARRGGADHPSLAYAQTVLCEMEGVMLVPLK
jgi:hypothetical protein